MSDWRAGATIQQVAGIDKDADGRPYVLVLIDNEWRMFLLDGERAAEVKFDNTPQESHDKQFICPECGCEFWIIEAEREETE